MKSSKSILSVLALSLVVFGSGDLKANHNYSDTSATDKRSAAVVSIDDKLPPVVLDLNWEYKSPATADLLEKYTPEQLNQLLEVWSNWFHYSSDSERIQLNPVSSNSADASGHIRPEQIAEWLEILF